MNPLIWVIIVTVILINLEQYLRKHITGGVKWDWRYLYEWAVQLISSGLIFKWISEAQAFDGNTVTLAIAFGFGIVKGTQEIRKWLTPK